MEVPVDSPPYLFDQYAKVCGVSATNAKRALMLKELAGNGRTLAEAAVSLGIKRDTAQTIARRFIIDFKDYRPYSRLENKGQPRPHPYNRDVMLPASGLPLFAQ
jgi:hypothetical protein